MQVFVDHAPLMLRSAGDLILYQKELFVVLDGDEPDGKINCRPVAFMVDSGEFIWTQTPRESQHFDKTTVVECVQIKGEP